MLAADREEPGTKTRAIQSAIRAVYWPARVGIVLAFLNLVASGLGDYFAVAVQSRLGPLNWYLSWGLALWFTLSLIGKFRESIAQDALAHNKLIDSDDPNSRSLYRDTTHIETGARVLSIFMVVAFGLTGLQEAGVSMSALAAFGGFGGLAVTFAAKDFLSNIFGGLMIYLDKPFTAGDWIKAEADGIEGIVEDVGWRITTIRKFNKVPLYVMNAQFAKINVENISRLTHYRLYERLYIDTADAALAPAIMRSVAGMLESHSEVDDSQTVLVKVDSIEDGRLRFFVLCYCRTTKWALYHQIKQELLLNINQIVQEHGSKLITPQRAVLFQPELAVENNL
ncbi:MscS family membrane protein [Ferrimonas marina]|uniref:MscS family membrane protein n=2 Tax=Ferrimonas marina TaxID=299255 RepID=A0A1M5TAE8_9GAMM|nr:MscS family membrane protein [Ferrimonas marina]